MNSSKYSIHHWKSAHLKISIRQKIKVLNSKNGFWVFLKWGFRSLLCTYFDPFNDLYPLYNQKIAYIWTPSTSSIWNSKAPVLNLFINNCIRWGTCSGSWVQTLYLLSFSSIQFPYPSRWETKWSKLSKMIKCLKLFHKIF